MCGVEILNWFDQKRGAPSKNRHWGERGGRLRIENEKTKEHEKTQSILPSPIDIHKPNKNPNRTHRKASIPIPQYRTLSLMISYPVEP